MRLPDTARKLVESGSLAHLVTLNSDGSPQVSCVWIGLDHDEIVSGHLAADQHKLKNVVRDPRVALSIEGTEIHPPGLKEYLVVHGRARLVERRGGRATAAARLRVPRPGGEVPADGQSSARQRHAHHGRPHRWRRPVGRAIKRTRLRWVVLGAAAATVATTKGRRLVRRSIAAYLQPSIRFLPEDSDIASSSPPRL